MTGEAIIKWLLFAVSLTGAGIAFYTILKGDKVVAGIAVGFSLALMVLNNISLIETFEMLGIKAKMRSNLSESQELLTEARQVAQDLADISYQSVLSQLADQNARSDRVYAWIRLFESLRSKSKSSGVDIGGLKRQYLIRAGLEATKKYNSHFRINFVDTPNDLKLYVASMSATAVLDDAGLLTTKGFNLLQGADDITRDHLEKYHKGAGAIVSDLNGLYTSFSLPSRLEKFLYGSDAESRSAYHQYVGEDRP